jgi:preprotein translocase SecE subunit
VAKAPSKKGSETKVTRISASDKAAKPVVSKQAKEGTTPTKAEVQEKTAKKRSIKGLAGPFIAIGRYFKGAWAELRQVRWPDRKSTWGMTGALIAFTAFFVVVILFLDFLFSQLFKLILGSN